MRNQPNSSVIPRCNAVCIASSYPGDATVFLPRTANSYHLRSWSSSSARRAARRSRRTRWTRTRGAAATAGPLRAWTAACASTCTRRNLLPGGFHIPPRRISAQTRNSENPMLSCRLHYPLLQHAWLNQMGFLWPYDALCKCSVVVLNTIRLGSCSKVCHRAPHRTSKALQCSWFCLAQDVLDCQFLPG